MDNTSYIALSRQSALARKMEIVANNLANANTVGFKTEQPVFVEYLVKTQNNERPFDDKLSFVQDIGVFRDTRDGAMSFTGNPLDVAMNGEGYLVVDAGDSQQYTRGGHLQLNESGQLVTGEGLPVLSTQDLPFFFAPNETSITINHDGTVRTENGEVGRLRVVKFEDDQSLRKVRGGLYSTDQNAEDLQRPDVIQGAIEESNVSPIQEMTRMIEIQRAYESANKMIETENERRRKAVDIISRVN
ncbi:MAG: flagellar basal-body rod protein FlgF [Alphaproteobacteria bacterium]|nr:flagellar basal-body rod protein FlgF [Alphaproteobacteria bacterium]MBF0130556.1 flagellar basal-body rod protein FlgF [Alphaproteobacteria bacterium]